LLSAALQSRGINAISAAYDTVRLGRDPEIGVKLLFLIVPDAARAGEKLKVVVPDGENLQFLSFWVALGSGAFASEDLDDAISSHPDVASLPAAATIRDRLRRELGALIADGASTTDPPDPAF